MFAKKKPFLPVLTEALLAPSSAKFWTIGELCEALQVHKGTVMRMVREDEFPAGCVARIRDRCVRFNVALVLAWVADGCPPPPPPAKRY